MARTAVASPSPATPLEGVAGVGPLLAARIRRAFGSDDAFAAAYRNLAIEPLLALDGLSERRAFDIVAQVRRADDPELTQSSRARAIRARLEDLLAEYASTAYGRHHVRLLPVLRDAKAIARSARTVMDWRDRAARFDRAAVRHHLTRITRLRTESAPPSVARLVVVDNDEDETHLREQRLDRSVRIVSGKEALQWLSGYEVAVYAYSTGDLGLDRAANVVAVPFGEATEAAVPERWLARAEANRRTIEALAGLAAVLGADSAAPRVIEALASTAAAADASIGNVAEQALAAATAEFQRQVVDLSLSGSEILDLLGQGVPAKLTQARRSAHEAARTVMRERAGLAADVLLPDLPLRIDDEEVARLEGEARARSAVAAFERARRAAALIAAAWPALVDEVSRAFRFDVEFALGCWAEDYDAHPAASGQIIQLEGSANLDVARRPDVQRIRYELGNGARVAVLTGANSGGKTTLLEQLAQFSVLHHWGLPVPASSATLPVLDGLYVFSGARSLDAGAFETFLRQVFPPLTRPGRKLVLLDEVEGVTELEAAGRILGVLVEEVARTDSLCVLVTHLPDEVVRHSRVPVRMDGIDAVGLDERFNLVVDRQPKMDHRARSTPELILKRVHARSTGKEKELFARILERIG